MAAKHPKKDSLNGFVSRATRTWQKKTKKNKKGPENNQNQNEIQQQRQ